MERDRRCRTHGLQPVAHFCFDGRSYQCQEKRAASRRRYDSSSRGLARFIQYATSEKGRARTHIYNLTEKAAAKFRLYQMSQKGAAMLMARRSIRTWNFPTAWKRQRYDRDYYQRRHTRIRKRMTAANKKHRNRNRQVLREYLETHPCVDCGEADVTVLEFDHVRGQKRNDVTTLANRGTSVLALRFEISKCEVRCANCHRRVTATRRLDGAARAGSEKVEPMAGLEPANLRFTKIVTLEPKQAKLDWD